MAARKGENVFSSIKAGETSCNKEKKRRKEKEWESGYWNGNRGEDYSGK